MSKFKVGDRVKAGPTIAHGFSRGKPGDKGTVSEVRDAQNFDANMVSVDFDNGKTTSVFDHRLELIHVNPEVKAGDKVRILEIGGQADEQDYSWWTYDWDNKAGDIVEVSKVFDGLAAVHPKDGNLIYGLEAQSFELFVDEREELVKAVYAAEAAVKAAAAAVSEFDNRNSAQKLIESFPVGTVFVNKASLNNSTYIKAADGTLFPQWETLGPFEADEFIGFAKDIEVLVIE